MGERFIKLKYSPATIDIVENDPKAFHLLTVIVLRAKFHDGPNTLGLEVGECVIGDDKSYGMTRKQRRLALNRLNGAGITASRGTNKGTVVKLINTDIYDLCPIVQGPAEGPAEGPTRGQQGATNSERHNIYSPPKHIKAPSRLGSLESNSNLSLEESIGTAPPKPPDCPQQKIKDIYHEILPTLSVIVEWTETDQKALRARWRSNPKYQTLDFWRRFFTWIKEKNSYLLGNNDNSWQADLKWIVRANNFAKIMNQNYIDRDKKKKGGAAEWASVKV